MRTTAVVTVTVCALLVGLALGRRFGQARGAEPTAAARPRPPSQQIEPDERMSQRLSALEMAVRDLKSQTVAPVNQAPLDGTAQADWQTGHEPSRVPSREDLVNALARTQVAFLAQQGYSDWAKEREQLARAVQPQADRVRNVSCRGTWCRLDVDHADGKTASDLIDELEFSPLLQNTAMTVYPCDTKDNCSVLFLRPNTVADEGG